MRGAAMLLLGLTLAAGAKDRLVTVNLQNVPGQAAVHLRYQDPQGRWHPIPGDHAGGSNALHLPEGKLVIQAERFTPFSHEWGQANTQLFADENVDLRLESGPNWWTLAGLAGLGAAGTIGWLYRRSRLKPAVIIDNEPLIRSDGAVPQRWIGDYKPVEVLGVGGMGVVYRAVSANGESVAIKVPAPHLIAQGDFRQRFLREVELGIRLNHPNLVKVVCLPVGDEPYLVLEIVKGLELNKVETLPWAAEVKRCLAWADQILDALAYVHGQGFVHRDLKPANIIALPRDRIKLMDFGIAHKLHGTRITGTDHILGTPAYMAPEQLQGITLDGRADLYALGVILYERLAGGLPYPDDVMELMRLKFTEPLPPLGGLLPDASPRLCAFVDKLVAFERDQRYPTAQAARDALGQLGQAL